MFVRCTFVVVSGVKQSSTSFKLPGDLEHSLWKSDDKLKSNFD